MQSPVAEGQPIGSVIEGYDFMATSISDPDRLIFKGQDGQTFLKLNPDPSTQPLGVQEQLYIHGFPVPLILERGTMDLPGGQAATAYIIEESAGETFNTIIECDGIPPDAVVDAYTTAAAIWTDSQLSHSTVPTTEAVTNFEAKLYIDDLLEEVRAAVDPITAASFQDKLVKVWAAARERLASLPFAINQGDFVSRNVTIHNKVIDFEYAFLGPVGYDAASSLFHAYMFPPTSIEAETHNNHEFSDEQLQASLKKYDDLFTANGLAPFSDNLDEMILAKLLWSSSGENARPQLQAWRWRLLWIAMNAYVPGEQGNVAKVMTDQNAAMTQEKHKLTVQFQEMITATMDDNLAAGFIVGGLARQVWRGPHRDIDMLVVTKQRDEEKLAHFREVYMRLHAANFYSPDREYPGEAMSLQELHQALDAVAEREPVAVIPIGEEIIYDGVVWSNMLNRERAAIIGDQTLLAGLTAQARITSASWEDKLKTSDSLETDERRYTSYYKGDMDHAN